MDRRKFLRATATGGAEQANWQSMPEIKWRLRASSYVSGT